MHRPDNMGQIFGQDHLQEMFINWLENIELIPKSILFAGPYGVGKTTIARILANKLVGNRIDLKEINASEARGIDDVRGWVENSKFSPLCGGARVFILDELHQMTTAAQSALLKVIEEPPPHIYFILCTTEPQRLLPALRSRCSVLMLKLLTLNDTRALLAHAFNKKLSREIVDAIHFKSGGHARDAIKIAEIAVNTDVVDAVDLSNKVGLSRTEIEKMILNGLKNRGHVNLTGIANIEDTDLVVYVLDSLLDVALLEGNPFVKENYSAFLQMRIARKLSQITSLEQILHFLSLY